MNAPDPLDDVGRDLAPRLAARAASTLDALLTPPQSAGSQDGQHPSDGSAADTAADGDSGAAAAGPSGFPTEVAMAVEALTDLVRSYPSWMDKAARERLVRQRIAALLALDPGDPDPSHPAIAHLVLLRRAAYINALVSVLAWAPRDGDVTAEALRVLAKQKEQAHAAVEAETRRLAADVFACLDDLDSETVHPYVCWRVQRALRHVREGSTVLVPSGDAVARPGGAVGAEAIGEHSDAVAVVATTAQGASDDDMTAGAEAAADQGAAAAEEGATDEAGAAGAGAAEADVAADDAATNKAVTVGEDVVGENADDDLSLEPLIRRAEVRLWRHLEPPLLELLASHQLGLVNPAETVALAFGAACASLADKPRHADAAARACLDGPDPRSGWGDGRLVARTDDGRLLVAQFETFHAIGETLLHSLGDRVEGLGCADQAALALGHGLQVARDTLAELDDGQGGWAVEHLIGERAVDLGPTAAALELLVAAQRVSDAAARRQVLDTYKNEETWGSDWPSWLRWENYRDANEPDDGGKILSYIDSEIVAKRVGPLKSRSDPAVVLLFGPPGTTKTTIARAVATGLEWPLVTLSPGNFLREGIDGVERLATQVFDDLHRLSEAVVILDEADELFRERRPQPESEPLRGAAAFMTASMLPRLQDLHDRGRVVLFICTNFLTSIDPAMRRLGRVDQIIAVPPPDGVGRRTIIETELKQATGQDLDALTGELPHLDAGVKRLAEETERFIRGEVVQCARDLLSAARQHPFGDRPAAEGKAKEIATNRESTIAISLATPEQQVVWRSFLADLKALSEPHRRRQGSSWIPKW